MSWYDDYKPYVSVAERRAEAAKEVARLKKKGQTVSPVQINGRKITSTFWGQAWCTNLERYSDFKNRLPRGRTYVCNGSVVDLKIEKGEINALVMGSELYKVQIDITTLPLPTWQSLKQQCAGKIGTLVELLQGKLSNAVLERVTDRNQGLFPKSKEIRMHCDCPDYAGLCKHVAAAMYGIGNRLDSEPELLFVLRGVDHRELIEQAIPTAPVRARQGVPTIDAGDLGSIFDIEIGEELNPPADAKTSDQPASQQPVTGKPVSKKPVSQQPVSKKPVTEKTFSKKPASKKTASKKSVSEKPSTKKTASGKAVSKKTAAKAATTKAAKSTAKKAVTKKAVKAPKSVSKAESTVSQANKTLATKLDKVPKPKKKPKQKAAAPKRTPRAAKE